MLLLTFNVMSLVQEGRQQEVYDTLEELKVDVGMLQGTRLRQAAAIRLWNWRE